MLVIGIYRKATGFCVLILYPSTLMKVFSGGVFFVLFCFVLFSYWGLT
jgi:hypothetical protein